MVEEVVREGDMTLLHLEMNAVLRAEGPRSTGDRNTRDLEAHIFRLDQPKFWSKLPSQIQGSSKGKGGGGRIKAHVLGPSGPSPHDKIAACFAGVAEGA